MSDWDYMFKICLFASENVGRKTLIKKFFTSYFNDIDGGLIIGVDFHNKTIYTNQGTVKIQLFKLSNEERFKFLWNRYLIGSNGIMFMYDITNSKSLKEILEWNLKMRNRIPILLVGNKLDLEENREVSKEELEKLKEKYEIYSSLEISLKTGENVEEMFLKLIEMNLNLI